MTGFYRTVGRVHLRRRLQPAPLLSTTSVLKCAARFATVPWLCAPLEQPTNNSWAAKRSQGALALGTRVGGTRHAANRDQCGLRKRSHCLITKDIMITTSKTTNMKFKDLPPDELARIAALLDLKTTAGQIALRYMLEQVQLLDAKQQDYGSTNISGFGQFGVVVRMNDKFERIKHMFVKKRRKAENEPMRDSFRDIANYAVIALMLDMGEWPNE